MPLAAGTFGTGERDNIYNPGQDQWDIAFFKNVSAGGSRNVQFRAEIFIFTNHANWCGGNAGNGCSAAPRVGSDERVVRSRDGEGNH